MTRVVVILVVWLTLTSPTLASLDDPPDYSFLWNSFSSVRVVDGYALATTDHGLLVLELDQITDRYRPLNYVLLNTQPFTAKLCDSIISVRSYADIIYFVDISDLPNLTLLAEADIGFDFYGSQTCR